MACEDTEISKAGCVRLVENFFEIIKLELAACTDVMISGFGIWPVKNKRARNGRNPQTGEAATIRARSAVTFHYSKKLGRKLNS
jgi:integration host factor subunit alpha